MSGQPGLYKMPKELLFGAKDKLKRMPYSWWPLEEFRNFSVGRFDLYPDEYAQWSRDQIINHVESSEVKRPPDFTQLSVGCFHLKNFLGAAGQQGFIDAIREMCSGLGFAIPCSKRLIAWMQSLPKPKPFLQIEAEWKTEPCHPQIHLQEAQNQRTDELHRHK